MISPASLLVLLLTLLTHWPPQAQPTDTSDVSGMITQVCDHTLNGKLCRSVLESGGPASDYSELARIALRAAMANASAIFNHVDSLVRAGDPDPFVRQCLSDCSDDYQDAMDQIEDSLAALETRGYDDVSAWVGAAMNDADSCEEGFKSKTGYRSPLTDMNEAFHDICTIIIAISHLLIET
ncbi:pectinesterase inhibitor-like [Rhodamnia argentea]|uniref:Pectinesterase inhibitor-like n=1 Tax=Rhodamnia argentea TaxID=178133 RepID=A0ABM3HII7_9MYRT|nr:pectinesterase inhibitor-like [Rhodamnia argentea]